MSRKQFFCSNMGRLQLGQHRHRRQIVCAFIESCLHPDGDAVPFLSTLADLLKKGVDVRLIHAKEPGPMFRVDFDRYPILATDLERVCCPRVHFKLMILDMETAYIGSANLTGAGMGMKSENRRNFEAGILTNDPELLEAAINQFDMVWMGAWCKNCGRKDVCIDRIG